MSLITTDMSIHKEAETLKKVELFMLITNQYGSGYLYTAKEAFLGNDVEFDRWRMEVSKSFDPPTI